MDLEYSPIGGSPIFCDLSIKLALGENNEIIKNKQVGKIHLLFSYLSIVYLFISQAKIL